MSNASFAQLAANRANAQHSAGPVTESGKSASSRNSFKHGLTSLAFSLLPHENAAAFEQLLQSITDECRPAPGAETYLVLEIAQHYWLAQRAMNLEATAWNPDGTVNDRRLSLAIRYLTTHERLGRECRAQLKELQSARQKAEKKAHGPLIDANGFVSQNHGLTEAQRDHIARLKAQIDAEMDQEEAAARKSWERAQSR